MTSLSRIIRQSNVNDHSKEISIKSFAFQEELTSDEHGSSMTMQSMLEEHARMRGELQFETQQSQLQLQQKRQQIEEEIQQAKDNWAAEKEQLQHQAYEEGFAKGYEDGHEKITSDLSGKINEINESVQSAVVNADSYLQSQEKIILQLAIESANRIIGKRIEEDSTVYLNIIERALVEARDAEFIKIYTSSDYYTFLTEKRLELEVLLPPNLLFTIFMDEGLNGVECYLESNHGRMVISIDSQLNELKKSLLEIMESVD